MKFAQPHYLWVLLVALPAVAGLFYWSWHVKQKLIRLFISDRLVGNLTIGLSARRQLFRLALLIAALAGVLLALARPQWGFAWEEATQKGLDIIIAIDTSKSMLAQDVAPNRLEKAKLAAYDLMKQAKSDRLGLVVFAGSAFLQAPLTLDDQAFSQNLAAVRVGIIPQGGTSLSSAIRTSIDAFEKNNANHKVMVLFTDGEDHDQDSETMEAAREAAEAGVHIFTVGVGTKEGELLRVRDDQGNDVFVKDEDGNVVKSHLNQTLLQQIATQTGGFYLPLQGANPMETLYSRGLAPLPKSEATTRMTRVPLERYHWPLAFAILCLLLEFILPESGRRSRRAESRAASTRSALRAATAAIVCFLLTAGIGRASPTGAYSDYQSGNFKSAYDEYNRLSEINSNDYRLHYDAGAAAYRAKQLEKAEKQFNATLSSPTVAPDLLTQERTYYNLGNTEYLIGDPLKEQDKKEDRWKQAIDNYTQAIHLAEQMKTNDVEAKNNLAYVQRKLEELKQQQQQQNKQDQKDQQQQNQQQQKGQQDKQKQGDKKDQQKGQQQQSAEDKKKEEQKKQQQAQAKKDQEKKDQEKQQQAAQAQKGDKKDQDQQAAAQPGQMTPQEARQILASQKDDEKALIFQPETNSPANPQPGKFKDW